MLRAAWLLLAIAACATVRAPVSIDYQYADRPGTKRIELMFHNTLATAVCVTPHNWPNSDGMLDSGRALLRVGAVTFPYKVFETGYCPGCEKRVAPGEKLAGFLRYEDFGLPENLTHEAKTLEFKPQGRVCDTFGQIRDQW